MEKDRNHNASDFDKALEILALSETNDKFNRKAYRVVRAAVEPLCTAPTKGEWAYAFREWLLYGYFVGEPDYQCWSADNVFIRHTPAEIAKLWDAHVADFDEADQEELIG